MSRTDTPRRQRSTGNRQWTVFVSHNRCEKDWVRRVVEQWRGLKLNVFFDEDSIQPGEKITGAIKSGLKNSQYVVLMISSQSQASKWVAMETAIAIYSNKLLPVLLEEIPDSEIHDPIRALNRVDLTQTNTRRKEYHRLLRHLGVTAKKLPSPPRWPRRKAESAVKATSPRRAVEKEAVLELNREYTSWTEKEQQNLFNSLARSGIVVRKISVVGSERGNK